MSTTSLADRFAEVRSEEPIAGAATAGADAAPADYPSVAPGALPGAQMTQAEAADLLKAQLNKGIAIRELRIKYVEDLEEARAAKLLWTHETTELLKKLFEGNEVADYCNDWVGRIFPEYAEFGNFVEQFYEEMTHRIGRLREVFRRVMQLATPTVNLAPGQRPVQGTASSPATPPPPLPPAAPSKAHVGPHAGRPAGAPAPVVPGTPAAATVPATVFIGAPADADSLKPVAAFMGELGLNVVHLSDEDGPASLSPVKARGLAMLPAGGLDPVKLAYRAGVCAGRLGEGRVVLIGDETDVSNTLCLTYLRLDAAGAWKLELARHLKRAGFPVDLNRLC